MSKALALSPDRRSAAASQFKAAGIPTRRTEDWKYSDLSKALGDDALSEATASWKLGALPADVEQFDLSSSNAPAWVTDHLGSLAQVPLSAASLAYANGGVALRVNKATDTPVTLDFSGAGNLRALIVVEAGASLTLIERAAGNDQRNLGLEIILGANAQLNHVRIAPEAAGAIQIEQIALRLARDARYNGHYTNFGAKLSRLELDIALEGEAAEVNLSGVSVLGDGCHADVTTRMRHVVGHTNSAQLFKKVAAGKSRAVYQGKVIVDKGADKADSRQTAKALLLGNAAEADLKPELEIFADDVKCAHGAAVGDLDANSLFYLGARGIPEAEARHLLIHAFLEDAIPDFAREHVAAEVHSVLERVSA